VKEFDLYFILLSASVVDIVTVIKLLVPQNMGIS